MSFIDTQALNLICDGCGNQFAESVGNVKLNNRSVTCPDCGHIGELDEAGFEAAVVAGEKEIADLQAKARDVFKNLFKGGN